MSFIFSAAKKLQTAQDYSHVFKSATKKYHHKYFLVLATVNTKASSRLGLAIAKKHCKKAVDRNQIKRIIRENFRVQVLQGQDIVFISKPGIATQSKAQLHKMTLDLLSRLRD